MTVSEVLTLFNIVIPIVHKRHLGSFKLRAQVRRRLDACDIYVISVSGEILMIRVCSCTLITLHLRPVSASPL